MSGSKIFVKDRAFYKLICTISIPIVLQSLITTGVNLADTMMLTAYGETQLSASSLANQYISLYQIMCMGLGFGASVLTSRFWGAKDIESIKKVTTLMIRICVVFALGFNIVTALFPGRIMRIYTPDELLIAEGSRYLTICAYTFLFNGLSQTITLIMRSVHQVRLPLYTAIIALFANIFLNWVLIFGKFGIPAMGIVGAAVATLAARVLEFVIIVGYFLLFDKRIGYRLKDVLCRCREYLRDYVYFCVPVLVSDTLLGLGNNTVSVIMGHIGPSFVAAFAIISQITRMTTVFAQGISNAACVITGNTLGEGEREKAYRQGITFLALAVCIGVLAGTVIFGLGPVIVTASNLKDETASIAMQLVLAESFTVIFNSAQGTLTKGILRGAGDTRFLMVADILFLWLLSVPLGYFTGLIWGCPAFVVYLGLRTDWIVKSIWCTVRLFRGKWMHNVSRIG